MQDFYRLVGGFEEKAEQVQETVCKKLVLDMHYKAQIVRHKLLCCKVGKEDDQSRSVNLYADPGAIRGAKIAFQLFGHRLI
jgi:hypothetical protein